MFRKPVICSDIGGPDERVVEGVDGLRFRIGDARSLATVLRRAASYPELHARLSEGMAEPPTRERMVEAFQNLAYAA